ncbi:MAG: plastocyanin/azurin family copper-binding protein [Actinomycetota bacterium]|nr:plastocyanin/azurin family copper-binding protein [Actinomycetota bacterium]
MPRPKRTLCWAALASAAIITALAGCDVKQRQGDLIAGKQQFVSKCGSCHVLGRAKTTGVTGPNLDAAFGQDVKDGFKRSTIRGVVQKQILYPNNKSLMAQLSRQGKLPRDRRTADNIAAYVANTVSKPGQDAGSLGRAVATVARIPNAMDKNGTLEIDAFPSGDLKFVPIAATAKPGKVLVKSLNKSSVGHNIAVQGPGAMQAGAVVQGGATSQVTVDLKPGTYTFLCTVPGHEQAGMKGTLTVK